MCCDQLLSEYLGFSCYDIVLCSYLPRPRRAALNDLQMIGMMGLRADTLSCVPVNSVVVWYCPTLLGGGVYSGGRGEGLLGEGTVVLGGN